MLTCSNYMFGFSGPLLCSDSHSIFLPNGVVHVDACRRNKSLHQVGKSFFSGKAICGIRGGRMGSVYLSVASL